MKALVIFSVLLAVCSPYLLQKRSLLSGHEHHHQHHPLPHRGHQRRELLNKSSFRPNNIVQEARNARNGNLGENTHHVNHNSHGDTEIRSAPAGYLPPSEEYDDDLKNYEASGDLSGYKDQTDSSEYNNDDLTSYTDTGYDDLSQYDVQNVDEEDFSSGDGDNDSQGIQDKQGQYGVDNLEQYEEEDLSPYKEEDQPSQYGDDTLQDNNTNNLDQYGEEYDVQYDYEEEPLAVGNKSPEYGSTNTIDPVKDINDIYIEPSGDLYDAPSEKEGTETSNESSGNENTRINNDSVSDSYNGPADDSAEHTAEETYIVPDEGDKNAADKINGEPSELLNNKPLDELYEAPAEHLNTDTLLDNSSNLSADRAYIAPENTYGSPSELVNDEASDENLDTSEETELSPPPAVDEADTEITQTHYAAPSNTLENEYLAPISSPTSEYSALGSYGISGTGSMSKQNCPGGSIEHCVTVCPGVTARVYGACVQGCANRCA